MMVFGIVAETTIADLNDTTAKKSCESKKWSHCKGDKRWYKKKVKPHFFKEFKYCVNTKKKTQLPLKII